MSARVTELRLLTLVQIEGAAARILSAPSSNVQRVSTDEIYTFANLTLFFVEMAPLAGRLADGTATPAEAAQLRAWFTSLGFIPTTPTAPEETTRG